MDQEIGNELKRVFCNCDDDCEDAIERLRNAPQEALNRLLFNMIQFHSLPLLKLLIEFGADVNHISTKGMTPLHFACQCGEVEMAEYLINSGALRLSKCDRGFEALTYAVLSLSLAMVQWACQQGYNLNNQYIGGMTVLHAAVAHPFQGIERELDSCAIIEYLIQKGAIVTEAYPNPIQLAEGNGLFKAAEILQKSLSV